MSAADLSSSWAVALRVVVLQKPWLMKLLVHMMRMCLADEQFMSRLMLQHSAPCFPFLVHLHRRSGAKVMHDHQEQCQCKSHCLACQLTMPQVMFSLGLVCTDS